MTPTEICRAVYGAGMSIRTDGVKLLVKPAERLTSEMRQVLADHKPALLEFLVQAHHTATRVTKLAMRTCDHHGDGAVDRQEMRDQCLATPPHLQADLREHFRGKPAFDAEQHDGGAPC